MTLAISAGLDEEFIKCWVESFEEILKTNQEEDVEKDKKYDQLRKRCQALEAKVRRMKKKVTKQTKTIAGTKSYPSMFACMKCEYRSIYRHHIKRHMNEDEA